MGGLEGGPSHKVPVSPLFLIGVYGSPVPTDDYTPAKGSIDIGEVDLVRCLRLGFYTCAFWNLPFVGAKMRV